jgi:hypothetical protein
MKIKITVPYYGHTIHYTATFLDDKAYWIKLLSFTGTVHPPKLIFLLRTENGWSASCSEAALIEQLASAVELFCNKEKNVHSLCEA